LEDKARTRNWKRWGPYLSERQWGTVREDYSPHGSCWDYFSHDQARRRAYRWGEDGLLGITDRQCRLCFSLALWNHRDPILKERLFGLTGPEGNHGEDVKECYFYLDATPTHSYSKALYKYPQREYPYATLVEENRRRGKHEAEFELADVNPPVHAWSAWRVYKMTGERGERDRVFLSRVFQKLLLNFTWWVNRKDAHGRNLFSGGFLGLDNIGVFDRSQPLPTGGTALVLRCIEKLARQRAESTTSPIVVRHSPQDIEEELPAANRRLRTKAGSVEDTFRGEAS